MAGNYSTWQPFHVDAVTRIKWGYFVMEPFHYDFDEFTSLRRYSILNDNTHLALKIPSLHALRQDGVQTLNFFPPSFEVSQKYTAILQQLQQQFALAQKSTSVSD